MSENLTTSEQLDSVILANKQFTVAVAKAATEAITELEKTKADAERRHTVSDIRDFPESLPANGGNAATVNGHTVAVNVPSGAKFTDTVYTHPSLTAISEGLYKITIDGTGHVSAVTAVTKADILAFGISSQDINAAAASHTHISSGSVSIPASGWKTDSNTKFSYYYDLSISGITAADRVDMNVSLASTDIASACGLCPLSEAFAGKVRLRAKKAPTAAISAEYWITKK